MLSARYLSQLDTADPSRLSRANLVATTAHLRRRASARAAASWFADGPMGDLFFNNYKSNSGAIAGLSVRVIAEILAWSEEQVDRIIRRYVARGAATRAAIQQLNEARQREKLQNRLQKTDGVKWC
jgi:hypothetical protein